MQETQETWVWSLGWEGLLEEKMSAHSSILDWKLLWTEEPQSVSWVSQLCPTLCDPIDCSMPGLPVHHQLLEFVQSHVHWVSDAIQPSHPMLSLSPSTFNLSQHQGLFKWLFKWVSFLRIRSPKDWSFSFNIIPSNEHPGLISFRIDWLDLLAV